MGVKKIALVSLIAALYTGVSILLAPVSFGNIQVRIAEALTLLPILTPLGIYGVTLGCFLTNLIGTLMGTNIIGVFDIFFGTFTTLIAAILTSKLAKYKYKDLPILACLPPILLNGLIIGLELTFVFTGSFNFGFFLLMFMEISLGEFVAVVIIGLPIINKLKNFKIFKKMELS